VFLDTAQPAGMPERLLDPVDLARATGVYSVASRPDGRWVHRSYLRKFDSTEVASTPEATILGMLESGRINDAPIDSLRSYDNIILSREEGAPSWQASIVPTRSLERMAFPTGVPSSGVLEGAWVAALVPLWFLLGSLTQLVRARAVKRALHRVTIAVSGALRISLDAASDGAHRLTLICAVPVIAAAIIMLSVMLALLSICKHLCAILRLRWHRQVLAPAARKFAQSSLR
jgi:hypothetical protein